MPTLFRVESTDIKILSALQLTKLLKLLLHLEARNAGIAERAVEVALNITVRDGGEDGRIQWSGGPPDTGYLPCRLVQFQNKATYMGPTDCANEIQNRDGSMKRMVEDVLDNDGAYILFTNQELNSEQKIPERIAKIREKLTELGKPYADTITIDIYDAARIEGWVNKYVSAIIAVLNWVGRPLERGLKTWSDWGQNSEYQRFKFVADENRQAALESLKSLLSEQKKCARIIGLSGLGKTRLSFEVFRDLNEHDDLSKRVVYVDANVNLSIVGLVSDWVQCGLEGIVVVDNCDISLHDKLRREVQRADSKLSLLTLDYNLERASQTEVIHLKQLPDEKIKQMIEPVYGKDIPDLDRIIAFAQGFPQMAVLLADARLDKEPEMGRLTDDELANKMLWGGREPSAEDEHILRGCSLFDRFGIDDEVSKEYEFIASAVVGVTLDKFYDCVKRFEERGLIARRGRFARLEPKPLAIRLAAEWWRRTRPDKQVELITADIPDNLVGSFCDQVSRLDFLPEVKTLTAELCGPQGPFGQAEVILSDRGSRLFRALVEVNPDATSKALLNVLQKYDEEELSQITGDVRRNLVWALEKLCFHAACFEEAANSLLLLASSENENWSNNATGIFKQLFCTFLSGTEASPSMRLNLVDRALKSDRDSIRKLAVEALEQAITTDSGTRMIGAEYQGSGEPLEEWRPKVWGEAFEYWEQALDRLCNLVTKKDSLAPPAKTAIANNIRGLMQHGQVDILDKVIKDIVHQDGPLWPEALASIKDSLCYEGKEMPDEGKAKLQEWVFLLTPSDLGERLQLFVTNPPYEHEKKEDGQYEDIAAKNAKLLAEELAEDIASIIPFLDNLLIGEQRQAYWFGKHLVESAGKWEPLLSEVINKVNRIENPNINFLLGILNGIFNLDILKWNTIVKIFFDRKGLNQYYANALVTGKFTIEQLNCFTELMGKNKIEPVAANPFTYGRPLEHLDYKDVAQFVRNLAPISDNAAWIALDILSMYCHGDAKKWNNCNPTFKEIVIMLKLDKEDKNQGQLEMYHWHDVVKKLLKSNDSAFAIDITKQILASCTNRINLGDLWHYVQPIIRILFQQHAKDIWPLFSEAIKNAAPLEEYRLMQLLDSGSSFDKKKPSVLSDLPDELLNEWCLQNPETAPEFVARTTDVLLDVGDKYEISSRAKFLIDNFGDNEQVLSALSANMSSFGWSGSLVPYLQKETEALEPLKGHTNSNVKNWVSRRLDYLSKMIERETRRDEEHDWGVY
ncbi:MAG: hypothetical protein JXB42_13060 [Deltaproteobacteria bacterium]|nr:hypothetical protein [Deltaproteobacteria bacterium]